jgi:hypothetical protein
MLFLNPKWKLLGSGSGSGTSITLPASFQVMKYHHIEGFISGYSGNAIGRIRPGTTTVDPAGNCASALIEGVTLNNTSINAAGWPLAVTGIAGPRQFSLDVYNVSGFVKRMSGLSNSNSTSATTAPVSSRLAGIWNNTAAPIQIYDLTSFSVLTGTATGLTFNAGTEFSVWGKDDA